MENSTPEIEASLEHLHDSLVSARSELKSEKIGKQELQVCAKSSILLRFNAKVFALFIPFALPLKSRAC